MHQKTPRPIVNDNPTCRGFSNGSRPLDAGLSTRSLKNWRFIHLARPEMIVNATVSASSLVTRPDLEKFQGGRGVLKFLSKLNT